MADWALAYANQGGTVGEMFNRCTPGVVQLDPCGKWWTNRDRTGADADVEMTVIVADGTHKVELHGTTHELLRLSRAIEAHVHSARANAHAPKAPEVTS